MQTTTTSGYNTNVQAAFRNVNFGVQIAWQRVAAPSANFFTIGTSTIAGGDFIKSSGSFIAFFDKYQYTDYSSYVIDWSVQRKLGQYPFGAILAQADIRLDNTSNLFLPNFDATIGSGILPNRPIKVAVSIGSESLPQFTGFTGQPEIDINTRKMTLHAFDAMDYIMKSSITTSGTTTSGVATTTSGYLASVRGETVFQYLLTQLGFSANQYVLDQALQNTYGFINLADRKYGDIINDMVVAEQALAFIDEGGIFRFWNRQHFLTTSGVSAFSFNYNNVIDIQYENSPVINDVIVNAQPRAVQSTQKVWDAPQAYLVLPNSSLDVFADFIDAYGALPVTAVDAPVYTTLATTSQFNTNTASDGSGISSSSQLTLTGVYLFGATYKMTFRNNSSVPIYVTNIVLFGTPAKVKSDITQRYLDATSIEAYGRNPANNGDPIIISSDYIQDTSSAYSLAYTLVQEYGTPRRRFQVSIFPRPELQIGDWGQITIPDSNQTRNVYIVGIQTQMANDADFQQILWLEERSPQSYFTIGTSLIQGTDTIAP